MAFNPGGGTHGHEGPYHRGSSRLIAHGFDPSGCSYETDGADCVDSGLPGDSGFSLSSFPEFEADYSGAANYSNPFAPSASPVERCTQRFGRISLMRQEESQRRTSIISNDSGCFPTNNSIQPDLQIDSGCHSENIKIAQNLGVNDTYFRNHDIRAYVDDDGDTHLHTAIIQRRDDVVFELSQYPLPPNYVNFKDAHARTALHLTALTDQPELLQGLFQMGANPLLRDVDGETPLHIACAVGSLTFVKTLITLMTYFFHNNEIDPDVKNYKGFTPLHTAAANGHCDVVAFLVRHFRADVNAGDGCSGRTILHHAADAGDRRTVKFLLNEFANGSEPRLNVHALAHDNRTTPLALASGRDHTAIAEMLEEAGAQHWCSCEYDMVSESEDDS